MALGWAGGRFGSGKDDETNKDQDRQDTEKHQAPAGRPQETGNRLSADHQRDERQQNDDDGGHGSPMPRHLEHRRKATK